MKVLFTFFALLAALAFSSPSLEAKGFGGSRSSSRSSFRSSSSRSSFGSFSSRSSYRRPSYTSRSSSYSRPSYSRTTRNTTVVNNHHYNSGGSHFGGGGGIGLSDLLLYDAITDRHHSNTTVVAAPSVAAMPGTAYEGDGGYRSESVVYRENRGMGFFGWLFTLLCIGSLVYLLCRVFRTRNSY